MRFRLVLGFAAAGLWAASAFAQDCCAGSRDRGSYKEESGSSLEAKAWMRVSAPPIRIGSVGSDAAGRTGPR
jgi:hypothetical protein